MIQGTCSDMSDYILARKIQAHARQSKHTHIYATQKHTKIEILTCAHTKKKNRRQQVGEKSRTVKARSLSHTHTRPREKLTRQAPYGLTYGGYKEKGTLRESIRSCMCTFTFVYVGKCIRRHVHAYTYAYMYYVCFHVRMFSCMHVCMYGHMFRTLQAHLYTRTYIIHICAHMYICTSFIHAHSLSARHATLMNKPFP